MNVLAIDQGTSATKALVIGAGGEVLGYGSAPVAPRSGPDGAVTQDADEIVVSILGAGRTALRCAGVSVQAVGLGNQGETVLRWDLASGEARGPAISWQDRRAAAIVRELAGQAEGLTEITGLPLDPYFAAPKMAWLARQGDVLRAHGEVITTIDAWVTHRLTGAFVTDAATASRTMLLDLGTVRWSADACRTFGLDPGDQPTITGCAEVVGETSAFGDRLPVSALIVDQQAALLAQACLASGETKCTYGTGAFILANAGSRPPRSATGLAACVAWRLGADDLTTYCLDGQVYTAGAALGWLHRVGLLGDVTELDARAGAAPPGPGAPLFLPALAGLGAPFWAPRARAAWTALSLASDRAELVDAVVWGIAAQVAALGGALARDLGAPLSRLRVDGGLTRSRRLMQAQADLLQVPVELYPSTDATARGVGALAALGAGGAATLADAIGEWRPSAVFEPSLSPDQAADYLGRFEATAGVLAGWPP